MVQSSRPGGRGNLTADLAEHPVGSLLVVPAHGDEERTLLAVALADQARDLVAAQPGHWRLAGKGEKQVLAAPAAADAREAAVQVAAFEKALEHILFDGAAHAARSAVNATGGANVEARFGIEAGGSRPIPPRLQAFCSTARPALDDLFHRGTGEALCCAARRLR